MRILHFSIGTHFDIQYFDPSITYIETHFIAILSRLCLCLNKTCRLPAMQCFFLFSICFEVEIVVTSRCAITSWSKVFSMVLKCFFFVGPLWRVRPRIGKVLLVVRTVRSESEWWPLWLWWSRWPDGPGGADGLVGPDSPGEGSLERCPTCSLV